MAKDAEWAAAITGIAADAHRALAREMAGDAAPWSPSAGRCSAAQHGEQPFWARSRSPPCWARSACPAAASASATARWTTCGSRAPRCRRPTLPQGATRSASFIPVARIADMLLQPGRRYRLRRRATCAYPDIRLVYWAGGNPFHHHQDLNRLRRALARPRRSSSTSRTGRRPRATPTSCCRPPRRSSATTSAAATRDRYLIAMQRAIEPVGRGARRLRDLRRRSPTRLGVAATTSPKAATPANGCAHSTRQARGSSAGRASTVPPTSKRSGTRASRDAGRPTRRRCCSTNSAPIPAAHPLQDAIGQDRDLLRAHRRASATTTAPAIRSGSSPPNGWAAQMAERFPLHMLVEPAGRHGCTASSTSALQRARPRSQGREPITHPSRGRGRARHRRRRRRARLQRSRRLPRRRARERSHAPRRGPAAAPAPGSIRQTQARTGRSKSTATRTRSPSTSAPANWAKGASPRPAWSRSSAMTVPPRR